MYIQLQKHVEHDFWQKVGDPYLQSQFQEENK